MAGAPVRDGRPTPSVERGSGGRSTASRQQLQVRPIRLSSRCTPSVGAAAPRPARRAPPRRRPARWPPRSASPRSPRTGRSARPAAGPRSGTAPGPAWRASTSSPQTTTSKLSRPSVSSATSTRLPAGGGDQRRRYAGRAHRAQQLPARRAASAARSREQLQRPAAQPRRAGRPGPATAGPGPSCRIRIDSAMLVPTIASRAAGGQRAPVVGRPARAARRPTPSRCRPGCRPCRTAPPPGPVCSGFPHDRQWWMRS